MAVGAQLLNSPITATDFFFGAYRLNITDLPALIKVTPSFDPAGGSIPVPGTLPEVPSFLGAFLHEVPPISTTAISKRYKFLILIVLYVYKLVHKFKVNF